MSITATNEFSHFGNRKKLSKSVYPFTLYVYSKTREKVSNVKS